MVFDTSRITHTGSGNDNLRRIIKVNCLGFITRNGQMQSGKGYRIDAPVHQFQSFRIKAFINILLKDSRSLHCQRAIHINRESSMIYHQAVFLYFTQKIKNFLGSAHRKRRDYHISSFIKGLLNHLCKTGDIIRPFRAVQPVAVGGFHDNIICLRRRLGIPYQRLMLISDISRKTQFPLKALFLRPHFNAGGTQKVPDIRKTDLYSIADLYKLPILTGY